MLTTSYKNIWCVKKVCVDIICFNDAITIENSLPFFIIVAKSNNNTMYMRF